MKRIKQTSEQAMKWARRAGAFPRVFFLASSLSCFLTLTAQAVTPAVLVGPDLQPRRVNLQGLTEGTLSYFDQERRLVSAPLGGLLQVRIEVAGEVAPLAAGHPHLLALSDGQRLAGKWAGADEGGQIILWEHPLIGQLQVGLASVSAVSLGEAKLLQPSPHADRVILVNGDQLEGFVVSVTPQAVGLRPDREAPDAPPLVIPLERVAALQLTNPVRRRRVAGQHLVWLADGTRLLSSSLALSGDVLALTPELRRTADPIHVPLIYVARIEVAAASEELVDLASLPMKVTAGGSVFGVDTPPRRSGGDLLLHAPITIRFELPSGATRFSARAALDAGDAGRPVLLQWADMDLIVRVDERTLGQFPLDGRRAEADINVPVQGLDLVLELREGARGPIMDRLRLADAVILVRHPDERR